MKTDSFFWKCSPLLWSSCLILGGALLITDTTSAQLIPDTTLGNESSVVTPNVDINNLTSDQIDGGATRDANLFHSFGQFNVGEGRGVYFSNPTGIERILTRVTGGNASNILGTLGVLGNADLFLINPNGIIFGAGSQLDLKGSFIGSTANSIQFGDGLEFSATNPQTPPLLTINVPLGLQYAANPGGIQVQGLGNQVIVDPQTFTFIGVDGKGLAVQPNQTLALVGGEVALSGGNLTAQEGGSLELGSVQEGLVTLTPTNPGWALSYQGVENFQDILLSQGAAINTSGPTPGRIQVQGRRVTLTDGSGLVATNLGIGNGEKVTITASELIELSGKNPLNGLPSFLFSGTTTSGKGGGVTLTTERLRLRDGAQVSSGTAGSGSAGILSVNAAESVELIGVSIPDLFPSGLFSSSSFAATGDAGNLTINTGQLMIRDGATISSETLGAGRGGNLTINASRSVELTGTNPNGFPSRLSTATQGSGNAGNLTINTGRLILRDGAQAASATFSSGAGGTLSVNAEESVEVIGTSANSASGLFASAIVGDGAGGDLRITTPRLIVRDGATLSVSNFQSRNLAPPGTGPAGNLEIEAATIRLENQGVITAAAAGGDQGNITLNSQDIQMRGESAITTNATGPSAGGNITLNTDTLVALDNSDITANATNSQGGRVIINAQGIFGIQFRPQLTPESDITASSELGAEFSGIVEINTPDADPSSGLVELSTTVIDVEGLVAQNLCAPKLAGSSFVVSGRGGLPASPNDPLTDEVVAVEWSRPSNQVSSAGVSHPPLTDSRQGKHRVIRQIQGWFVAADGTIILTDAAPTVTPQNPALTHPGCVPPRASVYEWRLVPDVAG
ncbi:two-partner secretion domain-containing protein [Coleofasciculus chthonoplastes]|uniref:two-partner secretion domain-containing protein n=1 Tax=Coleofasciculus chthonoplastes TaxID=64178 RepID=UPI0033020F0C